MKTNQFDLEHSIYEEQQSPKSISSPILVFSPKDGIFSEFWRLLVLYPK